MDGDAPRGVVVAEPHGTVWAGLDDLEAQDVRAERRPLLGSR
jgi:hypothetical protein